MAQVKPRHCCMLRECQPAPALRVAVARFLLRRAQGIFFAVEIHGTLETVLRRLMLEGRRGPSVIPGAAAVQSMLALIRDGIPEARSLDRLSMVTIHCLTEQVFQRPAHTISEPNQWLRWAAMSPLMILRSPELVRHLPAVATRG